MSAISSTLLVAPDTVAHHQMHTLLHYLYSKQTPPFAVLGWQTLQKIPFDQPVVADKAIVALCQQLNARGWRIEQITKREGGVAFLLALTAYLGQRVADDCDEPIVWYRYETIKQLPNLPEAMALAAAFEYSVVARIGGAWCQPLAVLADLLTEKDVIDQNLARNRLDEFYRTSRQAVISARRVDLNQEANTVAAQYLMQLTQGKLWQTVPRFAESLQTITFDGSAASLAQLDATWTALRARITPPDVATWQALPEFQTLVYALGFYIGATAAQLAGQVYKWADYAEVAELLEDADFRQTLAHSFVMLTPEDLHTPLTVVMGQLFAVVDTPTAQDFAAHLAQEPSVPLAVLLPTKSESAQNLPKHWQATAQLTVQLIDHWLSRVQPDQLHAPCIVEQPPGKGVGKDRNKPKESQLITLNLPPAHQNPQQYAQQVDNVINNLYRRLTDNPKLLIAQTGGYAGFANLPTGRSHALVLEVRAYASPSLDLQLLLPYHWQSDELYVYPLVSNQIELQNPDGLLQNWLAFVYQTLFNHTNATTRMLWQTRFVDDLGKRPSTNQRILPPDELAKHISLSLLTAQIPNQLPPKSTTSSTQAITPDVSSSTIATSSPKVAPLSNRSTPTVKKPVPVDDSSASMGSELSRPSPQALPESLQQQLAADRARLQSELATTDDDKMRKLGLITAALVMMIILGWLLLKLPR